MIDAYGATVPAELEERWRARSIAGGSVPYIVCRACQGMDSSRAYGCWACAGIGWLTHDQAAHLAGTPAAPVIGAIRAAAARVPHPDTWSRAAVSSGHRVGKSEAMRHAIEVLEAAHVRTGSASPALLDALVAGPDVPRAAKPHVREKAGTVIGVDLGVGKSRTVATIKVGGRVVDQIEVSVMPPHVCPSCGSSKHLRRTAHGEWFCSGTCGGWHGRSLVAPVEPLFGVGDFVAWMGSGGSVRHWQILALDRAAERYRLVEVGSEETQALASFADRTLAPAKRLDWWRSTGARIDDTEPGR